MTKEEFREKARNLVDTYPFGPFILFDYDDFEEEMRVALVPYDSGSSEADMPLVEFLDDLYEEIKGDLK
jgi:hypothetical protein